MLILIALFKVSGKIFSFLEHVKANESMEIVSSSQNFVYYFSEFCENTTFLLTKTLSEDSKAKAEYTQNYGNVDFGVSNLTVTTPQDCDLMGSIFNVLGDCTNGIAIITSNATTIVFFGNEDNFYSLHPYQQKCVFFSGVGIQSARVTYQIRPGDQILYGFGSNKLETIPNDEIIRSTNESEPLTIRIRTSSSPSGRMIRVDYSSTYNVTRDTVYLSMANTSTESNAKDSININAMIGSAVALLAVIIVIAFFLGQRKKQRITSIDDDEALIEAPTEYVPFDKEPFSPDLATAEDLNHSKRFKLITPTDTQKPARRVSSSSGIELEDNDKR